MAILEMTGMNRLAGVRVGVLLMLERRGESVGRWTGEV